MAKKGISIPIASDTRDFAAGIKSGVVAPLEGVESTLDDLAEQGDRAGAQLEDSMRDAQRETEELADDHRKLGKVIRETSDRASRTVRQNSEETTSQTKRNLNEVGKEAKQNAAETFSSFDGSISSFADGIQGTLGGVIASLPPAWAAAGAAGAIGIGLVTAELTKQQEAADAVKAKLAEAYRSAAEEGRAYIDEAQIQASILDVLFDADQTRYQQAQIDAATLGITVQQVLRAQAGSLADLNRVVATGTALEDERKLSIEEQLDPLKLRASIASAETQRIQQTNDRYEAQLKLQRANAQKAQDFLNFSADANELIQKRNKLMADTPLKQTLEFDTTTAQQKLVDQLKKPVPVTVTFDTSFFRRNGLKVV